MLANNFVHRPPETRTYTSATMHFVHKTYYVGVWRHVFIVMWVNVPDEFERVDPFIERWCLDRWGPCGRALNDEVNVWYRDVPGSYAFMHETDAFEFKMRWCGADVPTD
ncbi:MAG: hypothetical protein EOP83_12115 [Verrucomicrobiaceae bacterium]|nr:MAG: hypothetical protein EOP83_12115 [Verrucomicrobiaceae bacterium]